MRRDAIMLVVSLLIVIIMLVALMEACGVSGTLVAEVAMRMTV